MKRTKPRPRSTARTTATDKLGKSAKDATQAETGLADQSAKTGQAVDEHGRQVDKAKDSQVSFTGCY